MLRSGAAVVHVWLELEVLLLVDSELFYAFGWPPSALVAAPEAAAAIVYSTYLEMSVLHMQ